ncbi:MAG TPA: EAL domain-containing protein, partial [Chromatiales bacterium]|nr:EAL domain-containing protein [Chromatiales bacterium]
HSEHVIEHLHALSDMGFKIAIDDFGTGYSSLSRLRHFPVDILKIDRSFVTNMATCTSDAALVKSTIDMAHTLGFQVVAEGVEDDSQLSMLMEFGCDIFQGYYFSKPICADEFLEYTNKRNPG